MKKQKKIENWEKEFDEKLFGLISTYYDSGYCEKRKDYSSNWRAGRTCARQLDISEWAHKELRFFIRQLLKEARQQEREKIIEKLKKRFTLEELLEIGIVISEPLTKKKTIKEEIEKKRKVIQILEECKDTSHYWGMEANFNNYGKSIWNNAIHAAIEAIKENL